MGLLDDIGDLADKAEDAAAGHKDAIKDGLEKAADVVDDKTGCTFSDHIDTGTDKAKDVVEGLEAD